MHELSRSATESARPLVNTYVLARAYSLGMVVRNDNNNDNDNIHSIFSEVSANNKS